ncbi:hypothetical protein VE00_01582 [Pseudogymnoascus sp. WSF 3629]|nr:hypothetical protein VE00_01582 [Pseudogymnoascus sp. WSF 3629]
MDYGPTYMTNRLLHDEENREYLRSQAPSPSPSQHTPQGAQILPSVPLPEPMTTPPPYTTFPPPGTSPAAEPPTSLSRPQPRASRFYEPRPSTLRDQAAETQRHVVEDVVEKMRKQIVHELGSMERRLIAKIEEQGQTLEEAVEERRRKGGDGVEFLAVVLLLLGMIYLTKI